MASIRKGENRERRDCDVHEGMRSTLTTSASSKFETTSHAPAQTTVRACTASPCALWGWESRVRHHSLSAWICMKQQYLIFPLKDKHRFLFFLEQHINFRDFNCQCSKQNGELSVLPSINSWSHDLDKLLKFSKSRFPHLSSTLASL